MSTTTHSPDWRIAVAAGSELAEHPLWDTTSQSVLWVDVLSGLVHRSTPMPSGIAWDDLTFTVGAVVGAAALRVDGGLVVATDSRVAFTDAEGRPDADPVGVDLPAGARFNDIACDPAGTLLLGTTSSPAAEPDGVLWSLSPAGEVRVLLDGVVESNGLAWSPEGTTLYYVDSGEPVVRRYRYDAEQGRLAERLSDLVVVEDGAGTPDGLVIDADGAVWVALWEGGALRRFSPGGDLLAVVPVPVSRPTCAAFAGRELDLLVLATAWEGLTPAGRADEPWAGHLLVADIGVRGVAPHRFAGGPR